MPQPLGYLLTWTTYGTWLPGDERGSVDDQHNVYGEEFAPARDNRRAANATELKQPPFVLGDAERRVVHAAVIDHCDYRGWELVALNVRSNHVHAVVRGSAAPPDEVSRKLKARATRCLREQRLVAADQRVWTERGSGRYLWDEASIRAAARYVTDGQGEDLV